MVPGCRAAWLGARRRSGRSRMRAVKLSLFTEVQCPPTASPARRLEELLEQAEAADRLGYAGLWLSEIHFQPEFSLLAAPYVVLGAVAGRTRRLRLQRHDRLVEADEGGAAARARHP